jgi:mono/diheme cytochrome c family protein
MSDVQLLGLFEDATPASNAIAQLRRLNVSDDSLTVMSGIPYEPEWLGRSPVRTRLGRLALLGAVLGLATGLFWTAGIFLLYPLVQGGQPIVPMPPSIIVLFEAGMLGTMCAAFIGLLTENRFPHFKPQMYDRRITDGYIGVLAELNQIQAAQAEGIFSASGARYTSRAGPAEHTDSRRKVFWAAIIASVVTLAVSVVLLAYEVVKLPIPSQMVDQDSLGYQQGPRLSAPKGAVPVQGPVLIAGQPATEPALATAASLQRGQVLWGINCALCHGQSGTGDGPLSQYFSPPPTDLGGDDAQELQDSDLFRVITQGRGLMLALAENLMPVERWDVINHVRTLRK